MFARWFSLGDVITLAATLIALGMGYQRLVTKDEERGRQIEDVRRAIGLVSDARVVRVEERLDYVIASQQRMERQLEQLVTERSRGMP